VPDQASPWNRRRAAHLYRRAGFAAQALELDAAVRREPLAVVRELAGAPPVESFEREMDLLAASTLATGKPQNLAAAWLYRMLHTGQQHLEKLVLFWHGHFATSAEKVNDPRLMLEQNALLRRHARGKFDALAQAVSCDPAMLLYLDSATNRKSRPNENFAREVMELFCLGVGKYTEHDVQELARALTGWEVVRGASRFNPLQHDQRPKTVLGQTGNFDSRAAIAIVCRQPAAPRFLTAKLVRYFICDEPAAPDELIEPLAREFQERDLDVAWLVERILSSQLFFSDLALGRKVRSPVELGIGMLRALEASSNLYDLAANLGGLGQAIYFPPSVKGWDGGRTWINSATLLARANFIGRIIEHKQTRFAGGDLASLAERLGRHSPADTVDWLLESLVATPVPRDVRDQLLAVAGQQSENRNRQIGRTLQAIGALPEFQLG
jgi:uncharacterized protein (DUF1800 family)